MKSPNQVIVNNRQSEKSYETKNNHGINRNQKIVKNTVKKVAALGCLAGFMMTAACQDKVKGTLEVGRTLSIVNLISKYCKKRPEDLTCKNENTTDTVMKLPAGKYNAKLKLSRKLAKIEVSVPGQKNKMLIKMSLPKKTKMPSYAGEVFLTAKKMKQSFDVRATIDTEESRSDTYNGTEDCSYTEMREVCDEKIVRQENGRTKRIYECEDMEHRIYGTEQVEYYNHYTKKNFQVELLEKGVDSTMAMFYGSQHDTNRIYTYRSACHPGGRN